MMTRDELMEWASAAPPWLNRIIRSHLEAWDALEQLEAEAAAIRVAAATRPQQDVAWTSLAGALSSEAGQLLLDGLVPSEEGPELGGDDGPRIGQELLEALRSLQRERKKTLVGLRRIVALTERGEAEEALRAIRGCCDEMLEDLGKTDSASK